MDMNKIKMTELALVGTWLHHWLPQTYCLNKYYAVHSYPCIIFLIHQHPLATVWPQGRGGFTVKLMKL